MDLYFKKILYAYNNNNPLYCFVPMPESEEDSKKIQVGEIRKFTVVKQRNLKFHRKYFALLNLVAENSNYTKDGLLIIIKHYFKMYDKIITPKGTELYNYHSISFDKMDQYEFEKFFNDTLDILGLLLKMNKEDKENLVLELLNNFM